MFVLVINPSFLSIYYYTTLFCLWVQSKRREQRLRDELNPEVLELSSRKLEAQRRRLKGALSSGTVDSSGMFVSGLRGF